jgi:hypothetical protein
MALSLRRCGSPTPARDHSTSNWYRRARLAVGRHRAPGVNHHGVWVDDVAAETERLVAAGWTLEMAQLPPEEGYGAITYVRSPSGFRLEPVTSALQPLFERWWAGGPFA